MSRENSRSTTARKLSLLDNARRRLILYQLLSNQHTDIDSIAVQMAAWEQDSSLAAVEDDLCRSIKIALHHTHLPKLADSGIIEFDQRSGAVVRDEGFDDIQSHVSELRDDEEETSEDSTEPALAP